LLLYTYIDDIFIASQTLEQHPDHVAIVLDRLATYRIRINLEKCHIGQPEVDFLEFRITNKGMSPLPEKTAVIQEYTKPTNVQQELRRFLGLINFYRRHIPQAAEMQASLHNALHIIETRKTTRLR